MNEGATKGMGKTMHYGPDDYEFIGENARHS
jgi:hypothetical protein